MVLTMTGAVQTADTAKRLGSFGSQWKVNDVARVFYPLVLNPETGKLDILVSAIWGHSVNDKKGLGVKEIFIPTTSQNIVNGKPTDPDFTYQFSRLAPAFVRGQKEKEAEEIAAKAFPSDSARRAAYATLEEKYNTKTNMKAIKPIIGGLKYLYTTECFYVPMLNGVPDFDNAKLVAQSLTENKATQLMSIINNPQFKLEADAAWLEVTYNFTAADGQKSTAGRVPPVGVTPDFRLLNTYPDTAENLKVSLSKLPKDSNAIQAHNWNYQQADHRAFRAAVSNYCFMYSDYLDHVPEDTISMVANSKALIDELKIKLTNEDVLKAMAEEAETPLVSDMPENDAPPTAEGLLGMDTQFAADDEIVDAVNDINYSDLGSEN